MESPHVDYQKFRSQLDTVLRQRDPARLRQFLIEQGQWTEEQQTDTEAALWMMIATSPALADMHGEAERWLLAHGHEAEAQAIFPRRGKGGPTQSRPQRAGPSGAGRRPRPTGRSPHGKNGRSPRKNPH
jgi:hypothetical protein